MSDFFEIDFLDVESAKSGDAIAMRYRVGDQQAVHVVDGGFQATGPSLTKHINDYYGGASHVDRVVVSHPDGDHAGGLRTVLETMSVGELWMLRPWLYADELIDRFEGLTSVDHLRTRLRGLYPNLAALEDIAMEKGIPIFNPFQGAKIGEFTVLAPSKSRYLDLIVESDRTPESSEEAQRGSVASFGSAVGAAVATAVATATNFVRALWGEEVFAVQGTSAENEMSVIQFARICDNRILLTADAGRQAMDEAAQFAPQAGLLLPGIDRFQVPHHGSRRNVDSATLDTWLGPKTASESEGTGTFSAIISSAKADTHHPRKAVVRALIHRGAKVFTTEGTTHCTSCNPPARSGWSAAPTEPYPSEQEEE